MSSDTPPSPPKPLPWPDQALEQLCQTVRTTADAYEFSPRRTERYEAWILTFLSWCGEDIPSDATDATVDPGLIGPFREALRTRTDTTTGELHEAMDALSFLFGAVARTGESLTILPEGIAFDPGPTPQDTDNADASPGALRTLQIGWQQEQIDSVSGAASDASSNQLEKPLESPSSPPDADPEEEQSSSATAKAYLRQYQTQLEDLHVSEPTDEESEE